MKAVDGSIISDLQHQLQMLPADVSHLILSIGGNDMLGRSGLLDEGAVSIAPALDKIAGAAEEFQRGYRIMLDGVTATRRDNHSLPTSATPIEALGEEEPTISPIEVEPSSAYG